MCGADKSFHFLEVVWSCLLSSPSKSLNFEAEMAWKIQVVLKHPHPRFSCQIDLQTDKKGLARPIYSVQPYPGDFAETRILVLEFYLFHCPVNL